MTDSKPVVAGRFKKGDPRINKNGRKSKEAVAFAGEFTQALIDEGARGDKFKKLAKLSWDKALKGVPFFVELVMDRTIGKVNQPISGNINTDGTLIIKVVKL